MHPSRRRSGNPRRCTTAATRLSRDVGRSGDHARASRFRSVLQDAQQRTPRGISCGCRTPRTSNPTSGQRSVGERAVAQHQATRRFVVESSPRATPLPLCTPTLCQPQRSLCFAIGRNQDGNGCVPELPLPRLLAIRHTARPQTCFRSSSASLHNRKCCSLQRQKAALQAGKRFTLAPCSTLRWYFGAVQRGAATRVRW